MKYTLGEMCVYEWMNNERNSGYFQFNSWSQAEHAARFASYSNVLNKIDIYWRCDKVSIEKKFKLIIISFHVKARLLLSSTTLITYEIDGEL